MKVEIKAPWHFVIFSIGLASSIPPFFTPPPLGYLWMALMFSGLLASLSFKAAPRQWIRLVFLTLLRAWLVVLIALYLAKALAPYLLPYFERPMYYEVRSGESESHQLSWISSQKNKLEKVRLISSAVPHLTTRSSGQITAARLFAA